MIGKIYKSMSLFFRQHVGEAKRENSNYELSMVINDQTPLVCSKQTGKYFSISWQEIIELAIEAGIDKEGENG